MISIQKKISMHVFLRFKHWVFQLRRFDSKKNRMKKMNKIQNILPLFRMPSTGRIVTESVTETQSMAMRVIARLVQLDTHNGIQVSIQNVVCLVCVSARTSLDVSYDSVFV